MEPLHLPETDECPFVHDRELGKMEARWVRPKIVVTVKFSEWTDDDSLRAPMFLGIRTEVNPDTVRRDLLPDS